MKRSQIIQYKESLERFLNRLRIVLWGAIILSLCLFTIAIVFLYNDRLLSSVIVATLAFLTFRILREYAVIITKKWVGSEAGQEDMLHFLDEEMKGTSSNDFVHLLERALQVVDGKK